MKVLTLILTGVLGLIVCPIYTADYEIIKDLSPTHQAKVFRQLKVVKTIPFEFSEKEFLIRPTSITADEKGNIFVFDDRMTKIYSFDKNGAFRFKFSGRGEGPGEMACGMGQGGGFDTRKMNYIKGVGLLVNGYRNKWINVFNSNGKLIREIRLPDKKVFYPVMDSQHNLYKLSSDEGAVQVLNQKSIIVDTLLETNELRRFFKNPQTITPRWAKVLSRRDTKRIFYDRLSENRFLIYQSASSTVYIFKNRKLTDQYDIRPKQALAEREIRIENEKKIDNSQQWKDTLKKYPHIKSNLFHYHYLFRELFVEKDSRNHYYLASFEPVSGNQNSFFKLTTDGKLVEVLFFTPPEKIKEYCFFREKRNNYFYAIGKNSIYICKR